MMKISLFLNFLIVIMVAFSAYTMFHGIDFMKKHGALEGFGVEMFRYFTIDSNVLMGACSFVLGVYEAAYLCGLTDKVPAFVYSIKLMGTSAVMLTLLVTVFFLVPQYKNPGILFYNGNLFFHLLVPLMALLSFVLFEKTDMNFVYTVYGVIPTVIYAIYYVEEILRHLQDGKVDKHYDFYNFTGGSKKMVGVAFVVVNIISYIISVLIWMLN